MMDKRWARKITRDDMRQRILSGAAAASIKSTGGRSSESHKIAGLVYHSDAEVRHGAIENMIKLGSWENVPHILQALHDKDSRVRAIACEALGKLRVIKAKAKLYDALNDRTTEVRCAAGVALASMGDKYGLLPIARLVCTKGPGQMVALRALRMITGQRFPITKQGLKEAIRWVKLSGKTKGRV